jgi:hypothetical protein
MSKIIIDEKEYLELMKIKEILERILKSKKRKIPKRNGFLKAFGVLEEIKRSSLNYVSKLREEWRK